jgi:hypothetical protein
MEEGGMNAADPFEEAINEMDGAAFVDDEPEGPAWPNAIAAPAYHGIAGEVISTIEPATEADPAALLISFLVGVGNVIGRNLYIEVEGARHCANLFAAIVGRSSKARKGSSWKWNHRVIEIASPNWAEFHIISGLSSGEGVLWAVRDPIFKREPVKGDGQRYQEVEIDPGISDKRILVMESELSSAFKVAERAGNTVSDFLRRAWDGDVLMTTTKNTPARATGAHISLLGHITVDELNRRLDNTEIANGLANRFLWTCAKRSKLLPLGGKIEKAELVVLADRLRTVFEWASQRHEPVWFSDEAEAGWINVYAELSAERPGMLGAILARAEAQVLRLSLLYAALDCSTIIELSHLQAALTIWEYCESSARYIFGDRLGDPDADMILTALRSRTDGMSRNDIMNLFSRNATGDRIQHALDTLRKSGLARYETKPTRGRPVEIWFAVTPGRKANE